MKELMTDGWKCPVCGRGVAPGLDYCDHGASLYGPAYVRTPAPVYYWRFVPPYLVPHPATQDCACPPNKACGNTACPRRMQITCTASIGMTAHA